MKTAAASGDRRKIILYATLAVVVVAIVVAVGLASRNVVSTSATQAPIKSTLKVGDTAPEFNVATVPGPGGFDLAPQTTPVLLEVFATWCPHCQHETAVLDALVTKYHGRVAIVAVSGSNVAIDGNTPESEDDVKAFAQTFKVTYPVAFDPDLKVAHQYLQGGYPTLVLITKDKKVAYIDSGEVSPSKLSDVIDKVLRSS
ncbi:MAG: redoxin family protein [Candidatus Eremiobacteraeota bacterium]|nr:redoxin family protein [Candidatus Eremiobacteraeota bacterium]